MLARPNDFNCQVCERHCGDEERFFRHMHHDHPDFWRVYSGGRSLSEFVSSSPPSTAVVSNARRRDKRFACHICSKRYTNETGYTKHMSVHTEQGEAGALSRTGGREEGGSGGGGVCGSTRDGMYGCVVCSKMFTKEAYLLRHMEMKVCFSF